MHPYMNIFTNIDRAEKQFTSSMLNNIYEAN